MPISLLLGLVFVLPFLFMTILLVATIKVKQRRLRLLILTASGLVLLLAWV